MGEGGGGAHAIRSAVYFMFLSWGDQSNFLREDVQYSREDVQYSTMRHVLSVSLCLSFKKELFQERGHGEMMNAIQLHLPSACFTALFLSSSGARIKASPLSGPSNSEPRLPA